MPCLRSADHVRLRMHLTPAATEWPVLGQSPSFPGIRHRIAAEIGSPRNGLAPLDFLCYKQAMTPQAALQWQIERYRQMSGEERLALALELLEFSCDLAREGIRRQHPEAARAEVERLL